MSLAVLGGCGSGDGLPTVAVRSIASPNPPPTPSPTPDPGPLRGHIDDLTAARDIVDYNRSAYGRYDGVICRWELPIPVYIEPPARHNLVIEALEKWKAFAGTTYTLVDSAAHEPVLHVREKDMSVGGAGGVDTLYPNYRIRRGYVLIHTGNTNPRLYVHEVGHALGFFGHPDEPGAMCVKSGGARLDPSPREGAMLGNLYTIPHGARIETDGTWEVVLR